MKSAEQDVRDARAFFKTVWAGGAPIVSASAKRVIEVMAIRMYVAGITSGIEQMTETHKLDERTKS